MSQKRSIFEEVSGDQPAQTAAAPGMIDAKSRGARGAIRIWLGMLFALVAMMILVGGLTRLTDSGLSITEWNLVTGTLPPLNDADWQSEFAKYQQIPEFQLQNHAMDLEGFKSIYWWEWGHRFLGRFIGLVWAIGFFWFLIRKQIPVGWTSKLLILGGLGGLQGAIGWWMVSSGLTGRVVDVASYRLAIHLGLAFVILGIIAWHMMSLSHSEASLIKARRGKEAKLFSMGTGLMHFAFLQILLGALVAGIDAGRGYIDWPYMGGQIIPDGMFMLTPIWSNFFENSALTQFIHRLAGYLLLIFAFVAWRKSRASGNAFTKGTFTVVLVMMVAQAILGIVTVMNAAPLNLAIMHQLGAIVLWVLILRARFAALYPKEQSVRD
ncbi:heme A synthase [Thalassobius sp. I31.1]|uniref:heme A synthase n=1 Tax=Thalassobius sp. I31.1 TaxID=2109912 RepID=UPI000D19C6F0|nr:heme A synthase [Thalassobius sp. I31.1]